MQTTQQKILDLEAKILDYENRMGLGKHDPAKEGYLVLIKILKQQNDYLKDFDIDTSIKSDLKAKEYKNAKDLWEKLPDMIKWINELKATLKIEGEDKQDEDRPLTASDIANGRL